jgi:hypothetical protein
MSEAHNSLPSLERPSCPHCQVEMALERVSAGPIDFEKRLFKCRKCNHVETELVAADPLNSKAAAGWISGELGRNATTHSIEDGKLIPKSAE